MLREHPREATRDCGHCLAVVYDLKTGRPWLDAKGKERPRPAGTRPPCRSCPKGPRPFVGGLSQRNAAVYLHFLECRAVGAFPDDPIVKRNAFLISEVLGALDRAELLEHIATVGATK